MPQVVHSDSTRANIAKVAPRILEKVRPDRNPHSLFAAAQIIFHDDSRDLPPLANPRPIPHEKSGTKRGFALGLVARQHALMLIARVEDGLQLQVG